MKNYLALCILFILVITNLKPAVLRGVVSKGMLLACEDATLIKPDKKVPKGIYVLRSEIENLGFDEFQLEGLHVGEENGKQVIMRRGIKLTAKGVNIVPAKVVKTGTKIT